MESKSLKYIRKNAKLTQKQAAEILSISLRTYKSYENDENKADKPLYNLYVEKLNKVTEITENKGILSLFEIKNIVTKILDKYEINYCYLFGSYAKGMARDNSDIDLLIDGNVTGLDFFGLIEELRVSLHKVVDLLDFNQLENNPDLLRQILKYGIKIYG